MKNELDTLRSLSIDLLIAHPESSNFMAANSLKKLRMHIERTGRYEPILVRPHPLKGSRFEIINGHNRVRVLRALHHSKVRCLLWHVDDEQTRLYMATLNRLSGNDIPERRAVLMERLLSIIDIQELACLVPEDTRQLEKLERLINLESELTKGPTTDDDNHNPPVVLAHVLNESETEEVNLVIDLIRKTGKEPISRGQALARLARFYLASNKPSRCEDQ